MKVCVIGLGRFGYNVATTLNARGIEVLAIDSNDSIIASIKDYVTQAVCMRVTDEAALRSVGVEEMDLVIVATGENFAQSILITALLKQRLNVKKVITRSINEIHEEIVTLIGADETVIPEQEIGVTLAERLSSPFTEHFFHITPNFFMGQIEAPERFIGKSLEELSLYKNYNVRCVARMVEEDFVPVGSKYIIKEGDMLLFGGKEQDLRKIYKLSE
jgi:trk system potassium uptake protein TrkA